MSLHLNSFNSFLFLLVILGGIEGTVYSQEESSESEPNCFILTLSDAVSRALNSNRQLLGTVENLTTAQYGINLAESEFNISITPNSQAGYLGTDRFKPSWRVGGGVDISKKFSTGTLVSVVPSILKMRGHYRTEIQTMVTQPLLRGLGREYQLSSLRGAQFALRSAYRNLYVAQVQLIIRTIQTLYEIVKSNKGLVLNEESHQRISKFYQAAKLKEKIGLSDALDVYRAEMELRHAEDALKGNQERFEEGKDTLRDLLALSLDACIRIEVPLLFTPHAIDLDKAIEMALNHRIEMDQAQDDWRENERLSRLAKKNIYPELNLVVNYSNVGRAKRFRTFRSNNRENIWGVGLTTSTDLNPLAEQIAYEQSLIAISSASRGLEQTEATIILEVKKAVRQLDRASQRIHLQEEQIKTAQGELYLAKVKFDHGLADNFNVIQAEKSLRVAQQTYWTALIEHVVGEFQLLAAMGLLIDKPRIP